MQKNPHKTLRVYSEQLYANKLDNLQHTTPKWIKKK